MSGVSNLEYLLRFTLTFIVSGGKSSLLNILSAYNHDRYTGKVNVNGNPRDLKQFRLVSSYVMQDSLLQPFLTVNEAMNFSANLKIGKQVDRDDKEKKVSIYGEVAFAHRMDSLNFSMMLFIVISYSD